MKTPRSGISSSASSHVGLEALHLATERIPVDLEVGDVEVPAIEDDHARTRAEDRSSICANRLVEPVQLGESHDRRRLTAGDDEAVETVELLGQAHLRDLGAELPERRRVLPEGSLQGEDADAQRPLHCPRYQPRTSSRSSSASELAEMPTIGSPRPADTSARTLGSS